jgi:hypothetical protein
MKVSLIDVDGHNFPNLALMKLSAWHKAQGDTVDWYMPLFSHPDKIYASKVFTFTPDYIDYNPNDPAPIKGGTGYDATTKLPDDIEEMQPDYSIYPQYDYAIGFLTRGCIRKCKWCVVPKKEGGIREVGDIRKIGVRKNVILMDNNFLAASHDFIRDQLLLSQRMKLRIDFNQALDARLVDENNATFLADTRWIRYIRFSCDTDNMLEPVERAVRLLRENHYNGEILVYVLAKEVVSALYRIVRLQNMDNKIVPFCMPYKSLDGKEPDADAEVLHLARWCNRAQIRKTCTFKEYKYR